MTSSIKLGIIGCGGIATAHLKAARENNLPIISVSDISQAAVDRFLAEIPGAKGFTSYTEMLDQGDLTAIILSTPPRSHAEVAIAALERGIHVLCEKPLAADLAEAHLIEEAVTRSGACLMMAFRHRFTAAQQSIKAFLETGELGRIVLFQNVFGGPARGMTERWFSKYAISGGGTLMDTSIHSIDLFRHYCGEVISFSGELDRAFEGTDVEDSAVLTLRSESGALGIVASSWNYGVGVADLRIIGEKGSIVYDYTQPTVYQITRAGQAEAERVDVQSTGGFTEQMAHFAESIRCGTPPLTGVCDGRRAVEIITEVYRQRPLNTADIA